ncbi:toprim domain-containing protein [Sinanaerobacter sp. ZZT-01]|uniref:toprim domain-containing protein n=1 Tax=Sinanaerobacter sp. ZZT-01 TaxID=3111540 RepID=UPI002D767DF9|nr:toprim domain-containing protein [Sinanaerobacter sp. ZZT-01]WRR93391.1 toprim domain-containing protein [Sinanaerobacter sp. ZZT-01]
MKNYYTKEQIQAAKNTDLLEVVTAMGIQVRYDGKSKGNDQYRFVDHDSLLISKNLWYWNSQEKGGNTVDFLMEYQGLSFTESVKRILEFTGKIKETVIQNETLSKNCLDWNHRALSKKSSLILPQINPDYNRVIAYLNQTRGIDYSIIKTLIKKQLLFEEYKTHNALFFGYDKEQKARYVFRRGTIARKRFAGEISGSDKRYAFSITGSSSTVCVFESAIDALSYLTIHRDCKDTLQSLGGTALEALEQCLKTNPGIQSIKVCTDNDDAGKACLKRIKQEYKNYIIKEELPRNKDYNEDLLFLLESRNKELIL